LLKKIAAVASKSKRKILNCGSEIFSTKRE